MNDSTRLQIAAVAVVGLYAYFRLRSGEPSPPPEPEPEPNGYYRATSHTGWQGWRQTWARSGAYPGLSDTAAYIESRTGFSRGMALEFAEWLVSLPEVLVPITASEFLARLRAVGATYGWVELVE